MREPHHPSREELDLSGVLHALSDPARLAIVRHLSAAGECSCGHFVLGISKATLSHHFRVLREAGLVHARPEGRKRYLSLRVDDVEARFPGLLVAVLGRTVPVVAAHMNGARPTRAGEGDGAQFGIAL
jgi:DNA-binding transcriptional ArsR family regulator